MAEALDWVLKINASPDDTALHAALTEWLGADEVNAKAYRKAQRVWQLTGGVPPAHAEFWAPGTPALWQATSRRSTRSESNSTIPSPVPPVLAARRRRKAWVGFAGAVCAACAAVLVLPSLRMAALADYRTGAGESRDVRLADGSHVTLGASSALAVHYSSIGRDVVLLSGEAFFEVAHDPSRPFQVRAAGLTARDTGTAFDVDMAPGAIEVAVQAGMVAVSYSDGLSPFDETLSAGERVRIDRVTGHAVSGKELAAAIAAWRSGKLVVEDVSVSAVVQQLRRYFPGYIWIRDNSLGERRISGVYDLKDPISALKAAVEPHAGVVTEVTPFLLVVSAR